MVLRKVLTFLALASTTLLSAQAVDDALRFSFTYPEGTARYLGSAGGISPLGVDHTTAAINPAGLGWIRRNSANFTLGTQTTDLKSTLLNDPDNDPQIEVNTRFNIPAFGLAIAGETRSLNWPTLNFGITFNRLADFNEVIEFRGRSPNSLVQTFADDANVNRNNFNNINQFRTALAFEIGDVILEDDEGFFTDFDDNPNGQILRAGTVTRSGSMSELGLTVAGSYKDIVMWGLGIGIPFLNFEEIRNYEETDEFNQIFAFEDLSFDEQLEIDGTGVNFKLGVIVRPTQALRISLAAHTPTFWTLDETYETEFSYFFTLDGQPGGGTAQSDLRVDRYNLRTPWRFIGGLGLVVGRKGFVGAELDYRQFQGNQFSFDDFTIEAEAENAAIDANLTGSIGLRLGGSVNLDPFQISLGAGARQSAIVNDDELYYSFGAGVGYRFEDFFIDFGYQYRTRLDFFQPYPDQFTPQVVELDYREHNLALSFGLQF
ncbi:MAG: outer membrane beta-barrel protein [Bacteroidota bacterium]